MLPSQRFTTGMLAASGDTSHFNAGAGKGEVMDSDAVREVRDYLVNSFEDKALFRDRMAAEAERKRPWDVGKNEAYAASLRAVARYVSTLPDDDTTLRGLAECDDLYNDVSGCFEIPSVPDSGPSVADQGAIHCGPRGSEIDPKQIETWFRAWAASLIEEAPALRAARAKALRETCGPDDPEEGTE
jgi:hypothetical protein